LFEFHRLASAFGLGLAKSGDPAVDAEAARKELNGPAKRLLILDNASRPDKKRPDEGVTTESVEYWIPKTGGCHTIVTSREELLRAQAKSLEVTELELADAVMFLRQRGKRLEDPDAEDVARDLGRLPLALELAAAYVQETGITYREWREFYTQSRPELLNRTVEGSTQYSGSVAMACLRSISRVGAFARQLLCMLAFLRPHGIPVKLIENASEHLPFPTPKSAGRWNALRWLTRWFRPGPSDRLRPAGPVAQRVREGLAELNRYSLIRYKRGGPEESVGEDETKGPPDDEQNGEPQISVHKLVQDVLIDDLNDDERRTWQGAIVRLLNELFPAKTEDPKKLSETGPFLGAIDLEKLQGAPATDLGLLYCNLGNFYCRRLPNYKKARDYFDIGMKMMEGGRPDAARQVARAHRRYGDLLRLQGDLGTVERQYHAAKGLLAPGDDIEWGKIYSSEADFYSRFARTKNDLDEALRVAAKSLRRGLRALRKVMKVGGNGPDGELLADIHFELFQSYRVLADVHVTRGDHRRAGPCIEMARKYLREFERERHPLMGWLHRTQGEVHQLRGEYPEALAAYQDAISVFTEYNTKVGEGVALKRIGCLHLVCGDAVAAIPELDRASAVIGSVEGGESGNALILDARIRAGLMAEEGSALRGLLGKLASLLAGGPGTDPDYALGRTLLRPTHPGYQKGKETTLFQSLAELREMIDGAV
jgi:tetratricopeptide (TPR) repeat protein